MDVCLVNMPYSPVRIPSIALGILQAVLERDGFTVASLYANVDFAGHIGVKDYSRNWFFFRADSAVPEWTFSNAAFPDCHREPEEFVELLAARKSRFAALPEPVETLKRIRASASDFLDQFVARLLRMQPRVVGCTSTFFQHVASLALLRRVKEADPEIVTLLGGANCESIMGVANHRLFPWIDYVVSGEAEDIISPLMHLILAHGIDVESADVPFGVFAPVHRKIGYPAADDKFGYGAPRSVTKDLSAVPVPTYYDYLKALDDNTGVGEALKPGLLLETSRGCWWHKSDGCRFCGLNGAARVYRSKPGDQVVAEMELLAGRHGITRFEMVDNVLGPGTIHRMSESLEKKGAPYTFFAEIRPGLSRRQVEQLYKAGIIWVQPGIESLHSRILALMNKGTEAWQNIQLLKWLSQYGIRASWSFMYDFPEEDDLWYEEMASYMPLLFHLQPPLRMHQLRFARFSPYHRQAAAYGLTLSPAEPYFFTYPLPAEDLFDLVYFFDEQNQVLENNASDLAKYLMKPGLAMARKAQQDWLGHSVNSLGPGLLLKSDGDSLVIRDKRSCRVNDEVSLTGRYKDIYMACDHAPTREELVQSQERLGAAFSEIEACLRYLLSLKIVLAIDGRYVSLALSDPVVPLRPDEDFPGGFLVNHGQSPKERNRCYD